MNFLKEYSLKREEQIIESIANKVMSSSETNNSLKIKYIIEQKVASALNNNFFDLLDNILKKYDISQVIKKGDENYENIQLLIQKKLLKHDKKYFDETGDYYIYFEDNFVDEDFCKIIKGEFKMYIYESDLKKNQEYYEKLQELFETKKDENGLLEISFVDGYINISKNNNQIMISNGNLSFFLPKKDFPIGLIGKNNQFWKNNKW